MERDQALGDRETEASPAVPPRRRAVGLAELVEDVRLRLRADAHTGVRDRNRDPAFGGACRDRDRAALGELHRIGEHVREDLANSGAVRPHVRQTLRDKGAHLQAFLVGVRADKLERLVGHLGDVDLLDVELHLPGLDLREVKETVDEPEQVVRGLRDTE
ncbi:MAG: hypothetical protein AUH39_04420 [Chloroflexi bacterium 13_1_40CM_67_9]|nr:MAG: hypothetical protein AUH39_04420 [Chloroflexi bacterium 13_1_40CM_67_9]